MSNPFNKIVGSMAQISELYSGGDANVNYGTVVSSNPLKIRLDDGRILPSKFFILSGSCKALSRTVSVSLNTESGGTVTGQIQVDISKALSSGEKVALLPFNNNQTFFVERV